MRDRAGLDRSGSRGCDEQARRNLNQRLLRWVQNQAGLAKVGKTEKALNGLVPNIAIPVDIRDLIDVRADLAPIVIAMVEIGVARNALGDGARQGRRQSSCPGEHHQQQQADRTNRPIACLRSAMHSGQVSVPLRGPVGSVSTSGCRHEPDWAVGRMKDAQCCGAK